MRWEAGWSMEAGRRALSFETSSAHTFQGGSDTARETWQITVAGDYAERMHNAAPGAKKHIALRFLHPLFYVTGKPDLRWSTDDVTRSQSCAEWSTQS